MERIWLFFVVGAFLCWGAYGPTLHKGRDGFPDKPTSALRALLCVGAAYFLIAILVPLTYLGTKGQLSGFTLGGTAFSLVAGALGAGGAICIIWAFKTGGTPFWVMPLVFAGAPVVNAIISITTHPPKGGLRGIHPAVFIGLVMVAVGAFLILSFMEQPRPTGTE